MQVAALVAGHVAGLAIAHDRAVTIFEDRNAALRSQYAMLALMVLYTVGGLWLLSRGLMLAHGGVYGAIAEAGLALGLAGLFVWIWLRERRRSRAEGGAEPGDDG